VTQLKYLLNAYDYFTITVLQCKAVRKNTKPEIQYNENHNFVSEHSYDVAILVRSQ